MSTLDSLKANGCVSGVVTSLNDDEKEKFLNDISNEVDFRSKDGFDNRDNANKTLDKLLQNIEEESKLYKARKVYERRLIKDKKAFINKDYHKNDAYPIKAMIDSLTTINKPWAKNVSTAAHINTLKAQRYDDLIRELKNENVLNIWQNKKAIRKHGGDILEELRKPGTTKNETAQKIAKVLKKRVIDTSLNGLHEALIPIKTSREFMVSFHRNPERMLSPTGNLLSDKTIPKNYIDSREKAYQRWKRFELPLYDQKRTFGELKDDPKAIDKIMRGIYDDNTLDVATKSPETKNNNAFGGALNVEKKHKYLFPSDGYAFDKINKEYGHGDIPSLFMNMLDKSTQMEVAAKEWTTKPYNVYKKIIDHATERLKTKPSNKKAAYANDLKGLGKYFDELTGVAKIPESSMLARYSNRVLVAQQLAYYGSSIKRAVTDINGFSLDLMRTGEGVVRSYVAPYVGLIKRLTFVSTSKGDWQDIGYFMKDITGDVSSRFVTADSLTGMQAKTVQLLYQLNMIKPWDNFLVGERSRLLARQLWRESKKPFDKMNYRLNDTIQQYGLGEKEWELMRKYSGILPDKRKLITPEDPLHYSDEDIKEYLGMKPEDKLSSDLKERTISDFRNKMIHMFYSRAINVYLKPSLTVQALARLGTKPGTVFGFISRNTTQGQSWPAEIVHRQLAAMWADLSEAKGFKGTMKAAAPIPVYIAQGLTTAYLMEQIGNLIDFKKLTGYSLNTVEESGKSMAGLYGDAIQAIIDERKYGHTEILKSGIVGDAFKAIAQIGKKGEGLNLYHLFTDLPGSNLFYIKAALKYLIGYRLQEYLAPGSVRRMVRRQAKAGGSEYFIPPTG